MADEFGEGSGAQPLAVAENPRHRDLGVVVKNRNRNAAKKAEGRDMPVKKGFRRLRRIGLDETGVRMRQVEAENMQLHPHAADSRQRIRRSRPERGPVDERAVRKPRAIASAPAERNPSRRYSRRHSRARSEVVRKSASPYVAAWAEPLCRSPGPRRSPESAARASVALEA